MSELGKVKERLGTDIMDLYHYMPCKADSGGLGSDMLPLELGEECTPVEIRSSVFEAGTLYGDMRLIITGETRETLSGEPVPFGAW